jgi:hypothetical protein
MIEHACDLTLAAPLENDVLAGKPLYFPCEGAP